MRNVLSANLLRLWKSRLFWGCVLFSALYALWAVSEQVRLEVASVERILLSFCMLSCLTTAVFSGLFFGTEYSDGTMRNKLAVGCPRAAVYCANFLTNLIAALVQCAAYLAVVLAVGLPILGPPISQPLPLLLLVLGALAAVASACAIYTCVNMLCDQKAIAVVICVVGVFVLSLAMTEIDDALQIREYLVSSTYIESGGEVEIREFRDPQPGYVGGVKRVVYRALDDLLPFGQVVQYMYHMTQEVRPLPLIACSLGMTAAVTAAGLFFFRRKDLK